MSLMKPIAMTPAALLLLSACATSGPGFLNTDVLEPAGMTNPVQQGVKMQGTIFQEGAIIYTGKGEVQKTYAGYIDSMRGLGWNPASSEGEAGKGLSGRLVKDTRTLLLTVSPEQKDMVKVIIRVTAGAAR